MSKVKFETVSKGKNYTDRKGKEQQHQMAQENI
jgi:hypothetical protein